MSRLLWLFSVVASVSSSTASPASTTTSSAKPSIVFLPSPPAPDKKSPYLVDYSRIDWTQCEKDSNTDAYCLRSDTCHTPTNIPKAFVAPSTDSPHAPCSCGIQIKPITAKRWAVFVQFLIPDLDPDAGVTLYIENEKRLERVYLCKCYLKEGKSILEAAFRPEQLPGISLIPRRLNFSETESIMCVFEVKHTGGEGDVASVLKAIKFGNAKKLKLFAEVRQFSLPAKIHTIESQEEWGTIIDAIDKDKKRYNAMPWNTTMLALANDRELQREFIFTEVIKDFPSYGCESRNAQLVLVDDDGAVKEVSNDFFTKDGYKLFRGTTVLLHIGTTEYDMTTPVEISCVERICLSCPLSFRAAPECEGCTPPILSPASHYKDCPTLQCPRDMWMIYEEDELSIRHDTLNCIKSDNGEVGWHRSNGVKATAVGCAPQLSCHLLSPLNNNTCVGDRCVNMTITPSKASCPKDTKGSLKAIMQIMEGSEWQVLNTSLHCDFLSGTWYYGTDTRTEFNHSKPVRCELIDLTPLTFQDAILLYSTLSIFIGLFLFTGLFLAIGCCIKSSRDRWRDRTLKANLKKRPKMKEQPEYDDLTLIKDVAGMDEETFWRLLQDWPLYSIHERMTFVTNMLNELGTRVDIDHYLAIFTHCAEMESDPRVWRKLVMGFKIIMIAFNQVNRSRVAMQLNDRLKMCGGRLLRRVGFERTYGEDELLVETRNIALNIALVTNDRETITLLLEDGQVTKGREDIKRRRQIFAARLRGMDMQDEKKKDWEKIAKVTKEPALKKEVEEDEIVEKDPKKRRKKERERERERMLQRMRKDLEANNTVDEPRTRKEKEELLDRDAVVKKYGGWREHMIYAMCCGKNPDTVSLVLNNIVNGPFSRTEILAAFRACVEDCFDMRFAAKEVYMRDHKKIKDRVPVGTTEYAEIFEMFLRFGTIDFFAEENWLLKFCQTNGTFENEEKALLPIAQVTELVDTMKLLMKKCMEYTPKQGKPVFDEGPTDLTEPARLFTAQSYQPMPPSTKMDPQPTSSFKSNKQPTSSHKQNSGPSPTNSGPKPTGSSPSRDTEPTQGSGPAPNSGPKLESGSIPRSEPGKK